MTGYSGIAFGYAVMSASHYEPRRMNPVVRDMWTDALESGDYPQAQGQLCTQSPTNSRGFCCLGVLCDLAVRAGLLTFDDVNAYYVHRVPNAIGGMSTVRESSMLPEVVARWAGLWSRDPIVAYDEHLVELSTVNDSTGLTFTEIAQLIRESL